jgi:hypothetical protein
MSKNQIIITYIMIIILSLCAFASYVTVYRDYDGEYEYDI